MDIIKRRLATVLDATGLGEALISLQARCIPSGYVRAINYHGTPAEMASTFECQISFFAEHYSGVSCSDLDRFLCEGRWHKLKPGLIISFDDGFRSNYSVATDILERNGFVGWYFVPVDFIECAPAYQVQFAIESTLLREDDKGGFASAGRIAMDWSELRDLIARGHVVGSHTRTHRRLSADLSCEVLEAEICQSKAILEDRLTSPCECFAWVGGEDQSYSSAAADVIRRAGYRYSFMTNSFPITGNADPHHLQRNNVESSWSLALTTLQLCGLLDVYYTPKRRRVCLRTSGRLSNSSLMRP